jgi:hypothetical protein
MQKLLVTLIFCFFLLPSFAQTKGIDLNLQVQYNRTLHDYTSGNNPWGIGLGLQAFYQNKSRFKPTVELTVDLYLEDDKVFRLNPDGSFPEKNNSVDDMINLFAGSSFQATKNMYVSFVVGPSFINGQTFLGIKPLLGFFLSGNQKWTGKISYINILNRTKLTGEDFGSISLAVGVNLF